MVVYIIAYVLLCVFALSRNWLPQKYKNTMFLSGCGILLFLMCFRDISVGSDTVVYCSNFMSFRNHTLQWCLKDVSWEPGFVVLMKLLGYVLIDEQGLIFVMGLISLLPVMYLMHKNSRDASMSLVLFLAMLYTAAEYLYRQWIALLILLIAYQYVVNRKPVRFACTVLVAALFHRTALVFSLVYVLYYFKITNRRLLLAAAASVFFALTGKIWLALVNLFARLPVANEYNGGVTMLLFLWVCVFVIYCFSRKRLEEPWFKLQFILLLIAAVSQSISFTFSLWSRVVLYFRFALILLLPQTMADIMEFLDTHTVESFRDLLQAHIVKIPVLKRISLDKWKLGSAVEQFRLAKLQIPLQVVFYVLLFVYYWRSGIHDFKLADLFLPK